MKRVILIPTVFLVLTHTGDADVTEALVKQATGSEHAEGFEFEGADDSVNVTVTAADGTPSKVNVPANGTEVIVYNTDTKTWAVEDGASWAAKTVEYNPSAPAEASATASA